MPGPSSQQHNADVNSQLEQRGPDTRVETLTCPTQSSPWNVFTPVWDKTLKASIFQFLAP